MGELFKSRLVLYLIPLLNITFENVIHQISDIQLIVDYRQHFRKSPLLHILIKSCPSESLRLCAPTLGINMMHRTVFGKGEGEKWDLLVAAREMCG